MARPSDTYRPPKELPFRLHQQSIVFFNERQYLQGLHFLNQLLSSGQSISGSILAAYLPLPQQLALAATLAVHPQFTTRARSDEDLHVANEALRFLHNVNTIIGPINANFSTGFAFESFFNNRRRARRNAGSPANDSDEEEGGIRSAFAKDKCLFSQVDGIWQVIGWAFNCSVKWERRWARWKLWLNLLLDVLEDDWDLREELVRMTNSERHYEKSLIMLYLRGAHGRTERRRIMRAVLADGSDKALQEFPEVFENETKERRGTSQKGHKELNLEEDQWGDYDMDDEEETTDDLDSRSESEQRNGNGASSGNLGGLESIHLRQRLLSLLARVANAPLKEKAFTHLEDLFDTYTESFRNLPLPAFTQFVATFRMPLGSLSGLLVNLLIPYIPSAPSKVNIFTIKKGDLVKNILPYSANVNSSVDNAKMSLVIEALLASFMSEYDLKADEEFSKAIEEGIKNRREKAIGDARRKFKGRKGVEAEARRELEMSGERILAILEILEAEAEMTPRKHLPDMPSSPLSSSRSMSPPPDVMDLSDESEILDTINVKID